MMMNFPLCNGLLCKQSVILYRKLYGDLKIHVICCDVKAIFYYSTKIVIFVLKNPEKATPIK